MLRPGDIVDERFEVLALIGSGGLADVYKVRHLELGSTYALKLLTWRRAKLAERMVLEGRIQAQLKHPNIVAVVDLVRHDGQVGLLMEFVDGDTLEGTLISGPTPVDVALRLFSGVLAAVDAAHNAGVLHRDLKPANILMARSGSAITPKVADFGLAKVVLESAAGMTKAGVTMGTPGYLAPEQLSDAAAAGPRADIFALGVILHELLTGRRAYPLEGEHVAVHATANIALPSVREVAPHVPEHVAEAIACAVDRDPEARFPTCSAFAKALLRDHPSLLEQFSNSLGGQPVSLSLSGTSRPEPSGGHATYAVEPSQSDRRRGLGLIIGIILAGLVLGAVIIGVGLWAMRQPSMPDVSGQPQTPAVATPPPEVGVDVDSEANVTTGTDVTQGTDVAADTDAEQDTAQVVPGPEPVAPEPQTVRPSPELDVDADTEVEPDSEVEPDTEADTEVDPDTTPAAPEPVIIVTEIEPDTEPPPLTQLEGTWAGTAGRQRMTLNLRDSQAGTLSGTLTLTLGPTVRSETVSGTLSRDGRVQFTAGDLMFSGRATSSSMSGTYASNGRDRRFEWSASR